MSSTLEHSRPSAAPTQEQRSAVSSSRRDPWFDNAKMLLVTLVVVGHSWVLLPEETLARNWFYDFLYLWHMPAFVMVTGYLSRSFSWSRRNVSRLVTVVAVPYVIFEAAMAAFRVEIGGEEGLAPLFVEPHWPMWFLAVLFLWRLATPLLLRVPNPLLLAVVASLLGGLIEGDVLDVGRATGMLPFFVLGLVARREHLDRLRTGPARKAAAAVLAVGFGLAAFIDGRIRTEWMYWRSSYADLDATFASGSLIRLGLLVVGTLLALSALALVPQVDGWFTRLGAATMVVYLFHGFFLRGAEYAGVAALLENNPWAALVVTSTLSVVLALGLAAPPVARRLNVAVDPFGTWRRRARARDRQAGPVGAGRS
ncbi:MAG TPA: acyltransferase family protein [Nocardioidaceae bacterium]|nr:acyltransferase family protein [Nocardioidaceae bacterium]